MFELIGFMPAYGKVEDYTIKCETVILGGYILSDEGYIEEVISSDH